MIILKSWLNDWINLSNIDDNDIDIENGTKKLNGFNVFNVGTGKGISVKELINAFESVNNVKINYTFGSRRNGDLPVSTANVDKIYDQLGWKSKYDLYDMVKII